MMDILEVYERPFNPDFPVVCFDEKSQQLLKDKRPSLTVKPSKVRRQDYEYQRYGTVNLFVATEPQAGKRRVTVTKRRTKGDFAREIRRLVTQDYRDARKVILVMDNLNTHTKKSIIGELGKEEAGRILDKIEWHFTPKHASWLNMAEIEISVLSKQCLKRRISTFQDMQKQVAAWARDRNRRRSGIHWTFTRKEARRKFKLN
jgi:transposase